MNLRNLFVINLLTVLYTASIGGSSEVEPTAEPSSLIKHERADRGRSLQIQSALNPLGEVWKSANRMLGHGVHKFRESLREGVKVAQLLRDDVDEGVAKLMSSNQSPSDQSQSESISEPQLLREGVLGGLLKLMGVNSNQLGVIALNVLIIVAEWITSSLVGSNENAIATSRMVKDNLLEWVVKGKNRKVEKFLEDAISHSLPEKLIKTIESKTGNSTACVQLLICKMSPVIWGMQEAVKKQAREGKSGDSNASSRAFSSTIEKLIETLPPKTVFTNFGDHCEKRFPFCKLLKFKG